MRQPTRFVFALIIAVFLAHPAAGQDLENVMDALQQSANSRTVSVSGEGEVQAEPDQATVRFGVVTEAETAEDAREQNAEASSQAMNAVRNLDVPERKIRMETLRLQPVYERDHDRDERELVGYEARRSVVVELNDLETLPALVAEVVQQGANRLEDIQYGLQDRTKARNEALRKAVRNARDKAQIMTETLDAELGKVMEIQEQSFEMPRPQVRMDAVAMSKADDAAPEPDAYAAGELDVRAAVQVTFALE